MRGEGDALAVGRGHELQHPAELAEPLHLGCVGGARIERGDADGVLAERVVDPHHAVVPQRRREPGADAGRGVQGAGRAVAVGEPVHGAADGDDAGPAGGVRADAAQPVARGDAVRLARGARAAQPDVEAAGLGVERVVQQPEPPGRLVDDAGAVGGGVAGVERGRAVACRGRCGGAGRSRRAEGVEVAPALVVAEERDAVADQHRGVEVAVEVRGEADERALRVPPQLARGAAAVALLPRHLAGHGGREEHRGALGALGEIGERAQREPPRGAAVGRDDVGPRVASRRLARRADDQHLALGGPTDQLRGGVAPPGEPPRGAAVDRRDEHLRRLLAGRRPRHEGAVGRDPGPGHRHAVGREPVGAAPADRRGPHVVLRDQDERVAVQMGVAEVARGHAETVARRSTDRHRADPGAASQTRLARRRGCALCEVTISSARPACWRQA